MSHERAVVFGGSGFLGSHVADELTAAGYDVVVFDVVSSPYLQDGQEMVVGDIMDADAVDAAVQGAVAVFNFAGFSDLNAGLDSPMATARLNVLGHLHVLASARNAGVRRVVYASTVYVMGRQGGFYRCSKLAAEGYTEEYAEAFGLDFTILRFGSLYGPRSDPRNGLYRIVRTALDEGRLRYEGSPETTREYVHVRDAARASVLALGDDFRNRHVVITGQEPIRVSELLYTLGEILGNENEAEFVDSTQKGHYVRTPYAYRPSECLRFVPPLHVHFAQGLVELVDFVASDAGGAE